MENNRFTDALPDVADAVGTPLFERQLADAIGTALDYDFITMARYSTFDQPRFLIHSYSFASHMAELYLSQFIEDDPYVNHWRENEEPGVVWLQDIVSGHGRYEQYTKVFLSEIGVKDEVGVFMPAVAHDSLAFFYNNRRDKFTPDDIRNLKCLFTASAALYRLHIRVLMNGDGLDIDDSPSLGRPLRATNVVGETIWITNEWREQETPDTQLICTSIAKEFGTSQRFIWTLAPKESDALDHLLTGIETWVTQIGLTPREKDIVGLALKGHSSSGIADSLGLSVGNIKNHKRRIYSKLDITSERELFLMYIDAMSLKASF